jgi:hypothetical protein
MDSVITELGLLEPGTQLIIGNRILIKLARDIHRGIGEHEVVDTVTGRIFHAFEIIPTETGTLTQLFKIKAKHV